MRTQLEYFEEPEEEYDYSNDTYSLREDYQEIDSDHDLDVEKLIEKNNYDEGNHEIRVYFREIAKIPLLSKEEEKAYYYD